jgi:uncharacterized phosphosugar-binding protein
MVVAVVVRVSKHKQRNTSISVAVPARSKQVGIVLIYMCDTSNEASNGSTCRKQYAVACILLDNLTHKVSLPVYPDHCT